MFYIHGYFHHSAWEPSLPIKLRESCRHLQRAIQSSCFESCWIFLISPSTNSLARPEGWQSVHSWFTCPLQAPMGSRDRRAAGCQDYPAPMHSSILFHEVMSLQPKIADVRLSKQALCILTSPWATQLSWKEKSAG